MNKRKNLEKRIARLKKSGYSIKRHLQWMRDSNKVLVQRQTKELLVIDNNGRFLRRFRNREAAVNYAESQAFGKTFSPVFESVMDTESKSPVKPVNKSHKQNKVSSVKTVQKNRILYKKNRDNKKERPARNIRVPALALE
ncbi:hypothetical protein C6496_03080 [Candidatus Poribacteria bacterium]|nr:MAG: hypothetical protein C6496_03080 [Candidatus Poribacteria bacterium]